MVVARVGHPQHCCESPLFCSTPVPRGLKGWMSWGWFDFGLFIILRAGFDGSVQVNHYLLHRTHFLVWAWSGCLDLDLKNGTFLIKLWSSLRRAIRNIVVRAPCFAPRLSLADLRAGCLGAGLILVCLLFFELDLKFWDSSATIISGVTIQTCSFNFRDANSTLLFLLFSHRCLKDSVDTHHWRQPIVRPFVSKTRFLTA